MKAQFAHAWLKAFRTFKSAVRSLLSPRIWRIQTPKDARSRQLFAVGVIVATVLSVSVLRSSAANVAGGEAGSDAGSDAATEGSANADVKLRANSPRAQVLNSTASQSKQFSLLRSLLTPMPAAGTCDAIPAGNIEVEGTGGTAATQPFAYATLAAAIVAINAGGHTGTVTIDVCGNTSEGTATATLNASETGLASYDSITMKPVGKWTITGATTAGKPLIDLNGADNVMIDGLNDGLSSLAISNTTIGTTAGTSTIRFIADATNNTVTNCSILGSSASTLGTVAGTIVFSTGTTTGNDINTISNNSIGPAGVNLPSKAIMASGTSSDIENDNVRIIGNNIFDFFLPGSRLSGIYILAGNDGWVISNNKFYQTGLRTFTAAVGRYAAITLNNSTGSFRISGNVIGFGAPDPTGTTTITGRGNEFRGIDALSVSTTTATSIQGNTISGIHQTTSRNDIDRPAFIAVAMSSDSNTTGGLINVGDEAGNTIGSLDDSSAIVVNSTAATTGDRAAVAGIANLTAQDANISNNKIGAITIQGSGTKVGFDGILVYTNNHTNATINRNTIGGTSAPGAITDTQAGDYLMSGIRTRYAHATITGNTVRNMISNSNRASVALRGIVCSGSAGNNTVSGNTVHSLINTAGSSVWGMDLGFQRKANVVARNLVHSLSVTTSVASGQVVGIRAGFDEGIPAEATYRNNMVRLGIDADGKSVAPGVAVYGIIDVGPGLNSFYHNSVYIGGSGIADTFAFLSNMTIGTRNNKNNIYENNRSNVGGTALNVAYSPAGAPPAMSGLKGDGNVYYAPSPNVAIRNGTTNYTVAAWQAATAGANQQDRNSFDGFDPQFSEPEGTAGTVDLHLKPPPTVTVCERNGVLATLTDDFDADTRASLTPVDIGADAGNFAGFDPTPPSFSINDVTHVEGNPPPGTTSYTFTITKTGSTLFTTGVDYATKHGSAMAPTDFTLLPITNQVFLPAETSKQVTVFVNRDTSIEPDEAFTVHLSTPTGATISDADGTGTITNDDSTVATISGRVTYADPGRPTRDVIMTLTAPLFTTRTTVTNASGEYSFTGVPVRNDYTLMPSKTGDINGSIGSLDAAQVARYVVAFDFPTPNQFIAADADGDGILTSLDAALVASYVVGLSPTGDVGTWRFVPPFHKYEPLDGDRVGQDFTAILVGDTSGDWMIPPGVGDESAHAGVSAHSLNAPNATLAVTVGLPHLTGPALSNITVPITVGDLTGQGVKAYDLQITFDPTRVQLQGTPFDTAGTRSSGMLITPNANNPGQLIISAFQATDLTGSGTLINLKFTIVGAPGQSTSTLFQDYTDAGTLFHPGFRFNAGTPAGTATNGSVTVNGPTAAAARLSGQIVTSDGQPVSGATVTVLGGPVAIRVITDSNGFYKVENLEAGVFYTVTPSRANFVFAPANRSFSLVGDKTDAVFTGMPLGPDVAPEANPLESPEFFVRQQYLDFLGREPEQSGLDYWSGQLRSCGNNTDCIEMRRLDISAAFFIAQEFQDSGLYIYDVYQGALGRRPDHAEYAVDRTSVVGGPRLEADKAAFATSFVERAEFSAQYPLTMSDEVFVDALLRTAQQSSGLDLGASRAALINLYNTGGSVTESRSLVLRSVVEGSRFKQAQYNPAFVLMEYYGYLDRNPDRDGYDFWLNVLNSGDGNNYRGMVCSFITSAEYQQRFSSVVTRSNAECAR